MTIISAAFFGAAVAFAISATAILFAGRRK